jgi:hypothetical protein
MKPALALLLLASGIARAQPPLPPAERPKAFGQVYTITGVETLVLTTGTSLSLAPTLKVTGAASLMDVLPGDLVELIRDENGLVTDLTVLPRLVRRKPLVEVVAGNPPVCRFWWVHDGRDYPDSLYTAQASLPLQERAGALEATAACVAPAGADPVTFAVLGDKEPPFWEKQLRPGETAAVKCRLGPAPVIQLRCRRADGTPPEPRSCVWGSPAVVLQEPGLIALKPAATDELARALADSLKNVAPGAIAISQPTVLGLSQDLARDLQDDLFAALGRCLKVAGCLRIPSGLALTDQVRAAAKALGASSVLTSEVQYQPGAPQVRLVLFDLAGNEPLAQLQTSLKP